VKNTLKYWLAALGLIAWLVLSWFVPSWLHLQGNHLWILRIVLAVIGVAAFITLVWWFRAQDKERAAETAQGASGIAEIDVLMREAESRLQASSLGRHARLGNLPALFLLGESGSAKTSVVQHSGLEAELLAGHTGQEKVPVPTRAVNLWFARPFILAEAGGPVLSEPARWAKFVKRLAPGRLHSVFGKETQAPRAALVCVDSETFMKPGAAEAIAASVERMRTRLREVSHILGISLPVYVLFTRADRLQFFQDYVRNLSNEEATQVLGATFPMVSYAGEVYAEQETARVSAAFDELGYSLSDKRLTFLPREFDMAKRPSVYEFPREFRKLRQMLVQLLVDLCRPSQLRTGPFLRGFYFSGVRPIVINAPGPALVKEESMTPGAGQGAIRATGIFDVRDIRNIAAQGARSPVVTEGGETRRVPQWTFLPHLFNDVLLKDSSALTESASSSKTSLWRRVLLAASMGLLLFVMIGFIVSFVKNKDLESQVVNAAQGISPEKLTGQQLPTVDALNHLETLRQKVETLAQYKRDGWPFSMGWGLYEGKELYPDVRTIYFQDFSSLLFAQTQETLRRNLAGLPDKPGPNDQSDVPYDTLKAYLITTSDHDRNTASWLTSLLYQTWAAGRELDPALVKLAQKQFAFYSDQLTSENPYSIVYNTDTVGHARSYLCHATAADRIYRILLAEASKANKPPLINFSHIYPESAGVVIDTKEVQGAYTKAGWAFMQDAFKNPDKYFHADDWVVGRCTDSNFDPAKLDQQLAHQYQGDYITEWRQFLKYARVAVPYNNLADASEKLGKIASNRSPLLSLLCLADLNTNIGQPDIARAFQVLPSIVPPKCDELPVGGPNKSYVENLIAIQGCVDQVNKTPGPPEQKDAKTQCAGLATTAQGGVKTMTLVAPDREFHIDEIVSNLLLAPITGVSSLGPPPAHGEGVCQQMGSLMSKFPFSPQATQDATQDEIKAIFDPASGSLSAFHNAVTKTGQPQGPTFRSFIEAALSVQRALYPSGSGQMQFKYALRPHPSDAVASLTMSIDGQPLTYNGGVAGFTPLTWPGTTAQGVKLTVKFSGGSQFAWPPYDGLMGVFRFFADAAKWQKTGGSTFTIDESVLAQDGRAMTDPSTGKPVTVQFDLDTSGAPPILQKGYFASLPHCVSNPAK
jgi:type VI secretion system protein ImpL